MARAFGTTEIARYCEVAPITVGRWIKSGKLPHFRTGGGQHRVWARDLKAFLETLNLPVPPEVSANEIVRVLVVDDDAVFRRTIGRFFESNFPGVDVHGAADGFEVGLKIAHLLPALVILDLRLPGLDGFKVCRLIRSDPDLKGIKILCVSGLDEDHLRERALEAGADAFLPKPFDLAHARQLVGGLLA